MATRRTFGSYIARDTPVHQLDARVKLALLLAATVALFVTRSPLALGAMGACALAVAAVAGLGPHDLLAALRPTAVILVFSLLANALSVDGGGDVALWGPVGVSAAGAARGVTAVGRIVVLVAFSVVLCATTSSTAVADALSGALAPLARIGFPAGDVAMTMSVALRFIPLAAEEFTRVHDAQRSRGANFSSGSVVARLRRWLAVLTPLVVALFRRADDLADAMRERCYRGEGRTRLARRLRPVDGAVLALGIAACVAACLA